MAFDPMKYESDDEALTRYRRDTQHRNESVSAMFVMLIVLVIGAIFTWVIIP